MVIIARLAFTPLNRVFFYELSVMTPEVPVMVMVCVSGSIQCLGIDGKKGNECFGIHTRIVSVCVVFSLNVV